MTIQEYIDSVARRYASGITTEHSFRGDLQSLIESLVPDVMATNEPTRIACGAPDYVLTRKAIPVGYVEAKDVGADLASGNYKEQFDRYREALDNLAITDYLEFRFFESGNQSGPPLKIAEIGSGRVVPLVQNFDVFATRLRFFCGRAAVTIKGSQRLAEMMADKAKILAYTIREALESDEKSDENTELRQQMAAFRQILIHDLDAKQFADVYAQTIVYGMFAARLHDRDLGTFSRQEAAELIPRTNPFLRKLFHHIAGPDLDRRIDWIVNDLADLFRATDIKAVLKNYGKTRASQDPIMHFYETFLAEYDPKLRKARGVYYTPEPVVDFIVRAVDDILKTEFGLAAGLADTSKVKVKVKTPVVRKKSEGTVYEDIEQEFHRVQILDPATGTGTFLAQVIKQIYKRFENQKGAWPTYVENDLIPRLNGFELLMASYAMAHLKLDPLLGELAERVSSPHVSKGSTSDGGQGGALTDVRATDTERATDTADTFAPIDVLDYIYAVLHSPKYRERYKEFLKIDFPRVPYPKDRDMFWRLVELGGELRQLHLLESPRVEEFITGFNVAGSNLVDKPVFKSPGLHAASPLDVRKSSAFPADTSTDSGSAAASERRHSLKENMEADGEAELRRTSGGKAGAGGTPALQSGDVFINPTQYFANVPKVAWDFYIGGYQPAQKWLKDRKGRTLSYEDIRHYQKMIVALTETARMMAEIDEIAVVEQS